MRIPLAVPFALLLAGCGGGPGGGVFGGAAVQGSGIVVAKDLPVPGAFRRVSGEHAISLDVKHGDAPAITVQGDDNLVPLVRAELTGGTLRIHVTDSWSSRNGIRVTVTAPTVDGIYAKGAVTASLDRLDDSNPSEVSADGASTVHVASAPSRSVTVCATGASTVTIGAAEPDMLDVDARGASTVKVAGTCSQVRLRAVGASTIGDATLRSVKAAVLAEGASTVDLDVTESLDATASGASSVRYGGAPQVDRKASGASSVEKR